MTASPRTADQPEPAQVRVHPRIPPRTWPGATRRPCVRTIPCWWHRSSPRKNFDPGGIAKHFRVLFVFDPRREAILLTGGDKSGQWATWYVTAIPFAQLSVAAFCGGDCADRSIDKFKSDLVADVIDS